MNSVITWTALSQNSNLGEFRWYAGRCFSRDSTPSFVGCRVLARVPWARWMPKGTSHAAVFTFFPTPVFTFFCVFLLLFPPGCLWLSVCLSRFWAWFCRLTSCPMRTSCSTFCIRRGLVARTRTSGLAGRCTRKMWGNFRWPKGDHICFFSDELLVYYLAKYR